MHIRDRVTELRRVRAGDLRPHPHNWRTHGPAQAEALRAVLAEVGYAGALLAREVEGGGLELIDGHLRAETTPDAIVPVLVVDLNDDEAEKVLLTHDPLGAMAGADRVTLGELVARCETQSDALRALLEGLTTQAVPDFVPPQEVAIPESYQVVIECADEPQQQQVYERMRSEGFKCRVASL
ncbi:ParB-like nuclease domain protein [Pirellulimonas nuda]|uniref:ParB-like nuclease domain protein n=1 Tax=Pirellulimonas nuda TaxID=2528009 RepID=A0A518D654_9BACT|nr:ParB N-terminal domain-containing protein [Pirellulimonas nuda]QDU86952.1 ParB-like nuclease domain protein [Pirellulimonas nuda]